ncbi:hypothetical protein HRbin02_00336 [Candidatus Calditenuaceae archaeon HR02]|nr:hypothetical protein HRbin02_00336 [Candidatus Calditenuaceae archaeon HR02]
MGFGLRVKTYAKAVVLPLILSTPFWVLKLPPFVGVPAILTNSFLSYAKLGVITRRDLGEMAEALLSKDTVMKIYPYVRPILRIAYGTDG